MKNALYKKAKILYITSQPSRIKKNFMWKFLHCSTIFIFFPADNTIMKNVVKNFAKGCPNRL